MPPFVNQTLHSDVEVGVKICGVNSPAAFDAACDAGANWVGFVFFPRSPRYVTPQQARALSNRRHGGPGRVGLFVDPSDAEVQAALDAVTFCALQLYAPIARIAELHRRFGQPVWRAVPVGHRGDLPGDAGDEAALVIEPRPAPDATRPGGNATILDWQMLAGWCAPVPWLLAGGLTPDNVAVAIKQSGATAVDVSSGVETAPGVKDGGMIAAFVAAARLPEST